MFTNFNRNFYFCGHCSSIPDPCWWKYKYVFAFAFITHEALLPTFFFFQNLYVHSKCEETVNLQ